METSHSAARGIYRMLASGMSLDEAVTWSRLSLLDATEPDHGGLKGQKSFEWGAFMVYMPSAHDVLLPRTPRVEVKDTQRDLRERRQATIDNVRPNLEKDFRTSTAGIEVRAFDRLTLVRNLSRLAPADWATFVAAIEGSGGPHRSPRHSTRAGWRAGPLGGEPHWSRARGDRGCLQGTPKPLTGPSPPDGTTTVGQAFWNVPHPRNPSFTGREDVIAGLRERLARKGKDCTRPRDQRSGGIGETQTARSVVFRAGDTQSVRVWPGSRVRENPRESRSAEARAITMDTEANERSIPRPDVIGHARWTVRPWCEHWPPSTRPISPR